MFCFRLLSIFTVLPIKMTYYIRHRLVETVTRLIPVSPVMFSGNIFTIKSHHADLRPFQKKDVYGELLNFQETQFCQHNFGSLLKMGYAERKVFAPAGCKFLYPATFGERDIDFGADPVVVGMTLSCLNQ